MAWIYDISKDSAVNSRQIVSAYFACAPGKFQINVVMATGSPDEYTVYEKDCSSLIDVKYEKIKGEYTKKIQSKIKEFEKELAKEMNKKTEGMNSRIAELRLEIKLLQDKKDWDPTLPSGNDTIPAHQKKAGVDTDYSEQLAKPVFHKFLVLLSDPKFQNSKEPVNLSKIL
jgi:hypothetical protein